MFNRNSGSNEHDILQNQIRYNKLFNFLKQAITLHTG